MKTGKLFILGFILVLAACSPTAKTMTVTTEGGKCTLDAGSRISAGNVIVKWNIKDKTSSLGYGLWFLTLDQDKGYKDLVNYVSTETWKTNFPPPWSQWQGDMPDSQNEKTFFFQNGPIYLVCLAGSSSVFTDDIKAYGILGPVEVVK
jgi:hypothetical protein